MAAGPWNWLEVAKLACGLLTPLALALLGIYIHRITKRFEHAQWRSQKLIEKRLSVYDDLAHYFNDLLCYFTYVGGWKDLQPPDVVLMKRAVDKKLHLAAPLFSEAFYNAGSEFLGLCFETYTGWGRNALLRTGFERRMQAAGAAWKVEWSECFSAAPSAPALIQDSYKRVMEAFARDIGVHESFAIPPPSGIPTNIR
jgi:hypothetical protein